MNLFVVDEKKCKRCGSCVTDCPTSILTLNKPDIPMLIDGYEQRCINCGHCVAVCPYGAFSLNTMKVDQCQLLHEGWKLTPEQIEQLIKGRRSIRHYKEQLVDRDILTKVIEIACYAPTGGNSQSENWLVIYDPKEVKRLAGLVIDWMRVIANAETPLPMSYYFKPLVNAWDLGLDLICRNAPHLIVAYAPKDAPMSASSCTIALTDLELAALPFGLGTCWGGFVHMAMTNSPSLQEALDLPDGHQCFGAMMIGYPKFDYHRIPMRKMNITWR